MGANAQTTVPTFTTGQVLTATQMNDSARTGVPVFATTVERDAAFGGTGEKTLAEGQLCYLESTNVVQYYDGAAWATVGPATAGGLVFITGAAFTTVTSVSLPNDTFTSTYRNYRILFDVTASTNTGTMTGRLRAAGSDNSTANYSTGFIGVRPGGTTVSCIGSAQTSWNLGFTRSTTLHMPNYSLDIYGPQLSIETQITGTFWGSDGVGGDDSGFGGGAIFNATTSFDAMSFICGTGTITGTYRVYGYKDS